MPTSSSSDDDDDDRNNDAFDFLGGLKVELNSSFYTFNSKMSLFNDFFHLVMSPQRSKIGILYCGAADSNP